MIALIACLILSVRHEDASWYAENDVWEDVRFLVGTDTDAYTQFYDPGTDDGTLRVYLSADEVRISFRHIATVRIDEVTYHSGDAISGGELSGKMFDVALLDRSGKILDERPVRFFQSTGIAALYIHVTDGDIEEIALDKEIEGTICYEIVDDNGNIDGAGAGIIRARGNNNAEFAKKSYALNLDDITSLLGMTAASKWALRATPEDTTMLMDKVVLDTSKAIGIPYAIDAEHVNLYINGEYEGLYLLTQRVNANGSVVDIGDGSLMEFEADWRYEEADQGFQTEERNVVVHSPVDMDTSSIETLHAYVQEAEDAVYSVSGINESTGKTWFEYLDAASWIKEYWIQEFYINFDADYTSSFMTMRFDDPLLYSGPCWDFDMAFWHTYYNGENQSHMLTVSGRLTPSWLRQLDLKSDFHALRVQYYLESFRDVVLQIENGIPGMVDRIRPALQMMYDRYEMDIDVSYINGVADQYADWIDNRLAFYDNYMQDESAYAILYLYVPTNDTHAVKFAFRKGEPIAFENVYGITKWVYEDGRIFVNGNSIYEDTTLLPAEGQVEVEHDSGYDHCDEW